jgi:hypothetical protein
MIVIGVDVHKQELTAVAVDELGRPLGEHSGAADGDEVIAWACLLGEKRLWALEDCRHVTRALERRLLAAGERLVRVPPRLTAPQRRGGRLRGKSDAIDALAIARAALQEPLLEGPRPGERRLQELKLLVDHRGRSGRRAATPPAAAALAPAQARSVSASPASEATPSSPATLASPRSRPAQASIGATASTAAATDNSTARSIGSRSQRDVSTHRRAPTWNARRARARAAARRSAVSKRQLARTVYTTLKAESALT